MCPWSFVLRPWSFAINYSITIGHLSIIVANGVHFSFGANRILGLGSVILALFQRKPQTAVQ
jgi:hypothetical protein